ncbi:MAG: PIG-L deacetylase family protein [Pleomorphochaeta sp.]
MLDKKRRILVLAPHTDDGELGCGATIAKLVKEGADVYYVAFSIAEDSVPDGLPKDILAIEVRNATEKLGIPSENLIIKRYPVRRFDEHRQDILEELVQLNRNLSPDLVFIPNLKDLHQDHFTIANEALRAFKRTSILSYELPWNNLTFTTNCFQIVDYEDLLVKIEALKCYQSQNHRNYLTSDFILGLATTRGVQIGAKYAELFEVVRWIMK